MYNVRKGTTIVPLRFISITVDNNQVDLDKPVYAFLYRLKTGVSIKEMQMYRQNNFDNCQSNLSFLDDVFSLFLKTKN
jgi:hypothetical protein